MPSSRRRLTSPAAPTNDDLFLNLANDADAPPAPPPKSESTSRGHHRRKVCSPMLDGYVATPTNTRLQSSVPTTKGTPQKDDTETTSRHRKSLSQQPSPLPTPTQPRRSNTDAPTQNGSYFSQPQPTAIPRISTDVDTARQRIQSPRRQSLGPSTPSSARTATLRPSDFAFSTPDAYGNPPPSARDRLQATSRASLAADGLESEVSTTAPSTVWDELNELKVRMRKLEHGGNLAKAAKANGVADYSERPRTGTTQTTASTRRSSHTEYLSPTTTKITAPDAADLHPLLQSALSKARIVVGRGVYQALEATASDALQMAVLARSDTSDLQSLAATSMAGSTADGVSFSQKRVLRKADSLCRDLTELCIALCESSAGTGSPLDMRAPYRPSSRDKTADGTPVTESHSPLLSFEERRRLADRVERLSSRYNTGRLADRRDFSQSTVLANRMNGRHASVAEGSPGSPWTPSGIQRAATTASSHGRPATRDSSANEQSPERDATATLRAPARTNSDLPRPSRMTHSTQNSREYTSKHPLPNAGIPRHPQASPAPPTPHERDGGSSTETPLSPSRASSVSAPREHTRRRRAASNASSRAPPSTGAGLAERLEAKRQQQVASAQQLRGMEESGAAPASQPQQRPEAGTRRRSGTGARMGGE